MADETEAQDIGAEASASGVDPAAVALALNSANGDPSTAEDVRAFLRDQRSLIEIQKHHLHEQFKQLRLGIWEKRLGVLLRVATAVIGLAIATGLAFMVWDASRSEGLLIEPFSVPPDLAQRGLTGEVVAARVIDRLNFMQSNTDTARPARSYSNSWGEDGIKLEIPQTGVSLAELNSWLREKLGNDAYVTGEVVRTATGITVTARTGEQSTETVSGTDADIDVLVGKTAEAIYRITQPFRYAIYLMRHENRAADAVPIFKDLALHGSPEEQLWSYPMWASATASLEGNRELGVRLYKQAHDAHPTDVRVHPLLALNLLWLGRSEEALQIYKEGLALEVSGKTAIPMPSFTTG